MTRTVSAEKLALYNQQRNLKRREDRKLLQLAGGKGAGRPATKLTLTKLTDELTKLHTRLKQKHKQANPPASLETLVLQSLAQKDVVNTFLSALVATSKVNLSQYLQDASASLLSSENQRQELYQSLLNIGQKLDSQQRNAAISEFLPSLAQMLHDATTKIDQAREFMQHQLKQIHKSGKRELLELLAAKADGQGLSLEFVKLLEQHQQTNDELTLDQLAEATLENFVADLRAAKSASEDEKHPGFEATTQQMMKVLSGEASFSTQEEEIKSSSQEKAQTRASTNSQTSNAPTKGTSTAPAQKIVKSEGYVTKSINALGNRLPLETIETDVDGEPTCTEFQLPTGDLFAVDCVTIKNNSAASSLSRFGLVTTPEGKKVLPAVKAIVVFSVATRQVVYFKVEPGQTSDVVMMKEVLARLREAQITNIIIVADRGFDTAEFRVYCHANNLMYVMFTVCRSKAEKRLRERGTLMLRSQDMKNALINSKQRAVVIATDFEELGYGKQFTGENIFTCSFNHDKNDVTQYPEGKDCLEQYGYTVENGKRVYRFHGYCPTVTAVVLRSEVKNYRKLKAAWGVLARAVDGMNGVLTDEQLDGTDIGLDSSCLLQFSDGSCALDMDSINDLVDAMDKMILTNISWEGYDPVNHLHQLFLASICVTIYAFRWLIEIFYGHVKGKTRETALHCKTDEGILMKMSMLIMAASGTMFMNHLEEEVGRKVMNDYRKSYKLHEVAGEQITAQISQASAKRFAANNLTVWKEPELKAMRSFFCSAS